MPDILTDDEISSLLEMRKPLPKGWRSRLTLRRSRRRKDTDASKRGELRVDTPSGESFTIKCRQNAANPLDFSLILVYRHPSGKTYRLLRCNGPHESQHTNRIEKQQNQADHTFGPVCHIHRATQRYQEQGHAIDGYAKPTENYSDYNTALEHFVEVAGFDDPDCNTGPLFDSPRGAL